jgi:hypothetical protein
MQRDALREGLQWFALLGAALAWTGQFVVGQGMTYATCNVVGAHWGIGTTVWQMTLTASAGLVAVLAELAAVWLFLDLRAQDNEPPAGRWVFFAYAAVPANVIFLAIILLTGIAAVYHVPCVQS